VRARRFARVVPTLGVFFCVRLGCDSRMYLRYTTRKKDGKVHRYWRLVRSVRVGWRVIQQTVAHWRTAAGHLCLDKAYDTPACHILVRRNRYRDHIRRIGEEKLDARKHKRFPARRWVVERTLGWFSKCRGLLVRYEKKAHNYPAMMQLASALLWYRRLASASF